MSMEFRPMQKADVPRVAEMERLCFRSPWSESSLLGELKNSIAHYRVGELDGVITAYGGMWIMYGEAHITNVAVHPDFRGKGYGRKLMEHMIKTALLHGCASMTLEVRISNTVARNLYTSMGFEVAGRRKKYYTDTGEDGLIMWNRSLSSYKAD